MPDTHDISSRVPASATSARTTASARTTGRRSGAAFDATHLPLRPPGVLDTVHAPGIDGLLNGGPSIDAKSAAGPTTDGPSTDRHSTDRPITDGRSTVPRGAGFPKASAPTLDRADVQPVTVEPDGRVTLHADRLTIAQLLQLRDTFSRVHGECPIIIRCGGTPDLTFTDCDEPSSDRIALASG